MPARLYWMVSCLSVLCSASFAGSGNEPAALGPLLQNFELTLSKGWREEAFGPLFSHEFREDFEQSVVVPPVFSLTREPGRGSTEMDIAYPLVTLDRFGSQYRFQILQIFNIAGGESLNGGWKERLTIFPFYFEQRSPGHPEEEYFAFFPLFGRLQNRMFRKEIEFALWPLYVKTVRRASDAPISPTEFARPGMFYIQERRGEVATYNFVYPIFHLRYGTQLRGWQFWPLLGMERKEAFSTTNMWGEVELSPGHRKSFGLWPIYFNHHTGLGSENPEKQVAVLPFFSSLRSPLRDSTSYLWPLGLTITDDRARKYHEVDAPWPLIVWARGEGKTSTRFWPLFGQASNATMRSSFYLWPLYHNAHIVSPPLDRERMRILFFLYSDLTERNTATEAVRRRTDLWPLFTAQKGPDGSERLQLFAPLEPFLPNSKSIERNYSPIWSIWRSERNPSTGASSQSFLWNLYRHEKRPDRRKCSLLFGLFQYQSQPEGKTLRLFYIPIRKPHQPVQPAPSS